MRDLHRPVGRKIEAETEENLRALLELVFLRHFVETELLAAYGALLPPVSQGIQFRSYPAMGAKDVTGGITLGRTHLLLEVRQEGIRINNHGGSGMGPF